MSDSEKTIANLTEQVGSLTNMVKGLSETTVKTKRETLIKDSLKKAGLNEGFLKYITVDKDEDIEESVKSLKDEVLGLKQAEIDKKLKKMAEYLQKESQQELSRKNWLQGLQVEKEKLPELLKVRN